MLQGRILGTSNPRRPLHIPKMSNERKPPLIRQSVGGLKPSRLPVLARSLDRERNGHAADCADRSKLTRNVILMPPTDPSFSFIVGRRWLVRVARPFRPSRLGRDLVASEESSRCNQRRVLCWHLPIADMIGLQHDVQHGATSWTSWSGCGAWASGNMRLRSATTK